MSSIIASYTSPGAQSAFNRAQNKYRKRLTEHELAQIEKLSGVDQLIEKARTISAALESGNTSEFRERISNLAANIKPFERLLEGVCQLSPKGGDLIWGSVSFLLEATKDQEHVAKEVLGFFLDMAHEMEYLQTVERTHYNSPMVVATIEAVYIAVIDFWVEAVRYYRRRLKRGVFSSMMDFMSSSNMALAFSQLKTEISSQETRLDRRANAEYRAHEESDRAQLRMAHRTELLTWIGAADYERDFRSADRRRYDGTCEWLGQKWQYADWMKQGTNAFLVIHGTAGCGKTILSSWIIKQAQNCPPGHITLYHYFKDTDDSKNTPEAATRSFLEQIYHTLLSINHSFLARFESDLSVASRAKHMDFEPLWDIFSSTLTSQFAQSIGPSSVTIVLDALDECTHSRRLARCLQALVHTVPDKVRVVVTARKSGDHVDEFMQDHIYPPTFLDISQDDIQHDIASFIKYKICKIPRLRYKEHEDLRNSIIATFSDVQHHQGMFLWVHLMCKEIKYPQSVRDTWDLLDHMPSGLAATYEHICKRLLQNNARSRDFGLLVLQWVIASNRPIRFVELKEALKMVQTHSHWSRNKCSVNQDNQLIWSREDIVKSCGDLVRFGGVDGVDTIAPVHLSARHFFSISRSEMSQLHPSVSLDAIGPFLVDIPHTQLIMATTCLRYLLTTSSHSDSYLSPITIDIARTTNQDDFRKRYPLLDYSAVYWAEYALNSLETQDSLDSGDIEQLLATFVEFARSPVSEIWLEEFVRLTYIEFVENTVRRFTLLTHPLIPPELSNWSKLVLKALLGHSQTLSRRPQMIRLCMHQVHSAASSNYPASDEGIPPLEAIGRSWIHYDPLTDNLYSFDYSSCAPKLRCQVMKTGIRRRPLPATPENQFFGFHSAAISSCLRFIAVTYKCLEDLTLITTCWEVSDPDVVSGLNHWANVVFSHTSPTPHAPIRDITFSKDNTLVMSDGIFNIKTQQCVLKPDTIYKTDHSFHPTNTFFSGLGERATRINHLDEGDMLEVLNISGTSLFTHPLSGHPDILCVSDTGTKLIMRTKQATQKLLCFLVSEKIEVDMYSPRWNVSDPKFTADEGKLMAMVQELNQFSIGVWTFHGEQMANMDRIYTSPHPFSFCWVPRTFVDSDPDVLVADNESGSITRHPINVEWSPDVNPNTSKKFERLGAIMVESSPALKLVVWSSDRTARPSVLRIETWSVGPWQLDLLSRFEASVNVRIHDYGPHVFTVTGGNYLVIGTHIIGARMSPNGGFLGFDTYNLGLDWGISRAAFCEDGTRLVFSSHHWNEPATIYALEISQGLHIVRQASFTFDEKLNNSPIVFSHHDRDLFVFGRQVMRFNSHHLMVQTTMNNDIHGFSKCGLYYCTYHPTIDWPRLHPLQEDAVSRTLLTSNLIPPTLLKLKSDDTDSLPPTLAELGSNYIYSPHMLKLTRLPQVVILDHKLIDENDMAHRSRIICVLPDALDTHRIIVNLIWPDEATNTLKLVYFSPSKEEPTMINTGIQKNELMKKDEWLTSTEH